MRAERNLEAALRPTTYGEIKINKHSAMSENVNVAAPLRSYTPEEKAYHLKKMQVRFSRLDINKDGPDSRPGRTLTSWPRIWQTQ